MLERASRLPGEGNALPDNRNALRKMNRNSIPLLWIGPAFGVSLALTAIVLAVHGVNHDSLVLALRVTARWAFLFFWIAYTGRALVTLFGPALAPLARGREFGLAYAAAMLAHVGILVWMYQLTGRAPLTGGGLVFFSIGILFTYVLAVFSIGRLGDALGPWGWRALKFVAMNYILYAFETDFVSVFLQPATDVSVVTYAPFAVMTLAAPFIVLAAAAHRHLEARFGLVRQALRS